MRWSCSVTWYNMNWDEHNFADTKIGSWLVTMQHLYCLQFGYYWLKYWYEVLLQRDWIAVDKLKFHLSLLCLALVFGWQLFQINNFFACSLEICSLKWRYYSVNKMTRIKWSEMWGSYKTGWQVNLFLYRDNSGMHSEIVVVMILRLWILTLRLLMSYIYIYIYIYIWSAYSWCF